MNPVPASVPVSGDGIRLRPYRDDDLAELTAGCADPLTQRFLPGLPAPYTEADARWWIDVGAPAAWRAGGAAYAIADPTTDRLLGGVGLGRVKPYRGEAEIGYWVAPGARGRGVATAAVRALARHAFDTGLVRLELLTVAENPASQRVALAAGFQPEGVRRAAGPTRGGGRSDLLTWVRLAGDPPEPAPRPLPDLATGGLTDGVVTLRPLGPDDVDFLHRLHTLPEVVANRVPPVPPDRAGIDTRCRTAASRWLTGTHADLVILDAVSGTPAGGCVLRHDELATGQAMIGYSLLPEWRGRGFATRTVRLLAGWAFDVLGVARLTAGTAPDNLASQRTLTRAGFRPEGLQRGRLPNSAGGRLDALTFGLLPTDLAG